MKVIQISTVPVGDSVDIFGLGDNGNVYFWDDGTWVLNVRKKVSDVTSK